MNKKLFFLLLVCFVGFSSVSYAHSGRTDANGGHNCSQKSIAKGLCSGYHYHNGGGATGSSSGGSSSSSRSSNGDKDCSDFNSYDEVVSYWNAKGYSASYDPENLDGWGNNVVDDGIPCESPAGYDLSKVNNSEHQQAAIDEKTGEKAGYNQGYKDGKQNASKNEAASGSEAYQTAYRTSYLAGFEVGQKELNEQRKQAYNEGFALGKSNGKLVFPTNVESSPILTESFNKGYVDGEKVYINEQKDHYHSLGKTDGEKDIYNQPDVAEEVFLEAYEKGYAEAQKALEKEYVDKGYEAAFTRIEYKKPDLENEKFINWFKQGFESNKIVGKIEKEAFELGKNGEDLVIPEEYKKGKTIFEYYYGKGKEEYVNPTPFVAAGFAVAGAGGFLVFKRRRKKNA